MKEAKRILLERFFKGDCSPEEVHELMIWMNTENLEDEIVEGLKEFSEKELQGFPMDSDNLYDSIVSKIQKEEGYTTLKFRKVKKQFGLYITLSIAASISLLFLTFWTGLQFGQQNSAKTSLAVVERRIVKETDAGQRLVTKLPDGSTIKLNSNSRIEFTEEGFLANRLVRLKGEAFFDIKRNESSPFRVISQDILEVKVLGTSFNINTENYLKEAVIAVKTGKVQVTNKNTKKNVELLPGTLTKVIDREPLLTDSISNHDSVFGWVDNKLVFDNTHLGLVFEKVESWFGLELDSQVSLENLDSFTATFENPTIEEILESVCYAFQFTYEKTENNKVTIKY